MFHPGIAGCCKGPGVGQVPSCWYAALSWHAYIALLGVGRGFSSGLGCLSRLLPLQLLQSPAVAVLALVGDWKVKQLASSLIILSTTGVCGGLSGMQGVA